MKLSIVIAGLLMGAASYAAAQDSDSFATEAPAAASEKKESPAAEPAKEASPAKEAAPQPKAETKTKPAAKTSKKAPKQLSPEDLLAAEFRFLSESVKDSNADIRNAALEDLRVFVQVHPDCDEAPDALAILAGSEDYRPAIVDWLHLIYEYPDATKAVQDAKFKYTELVKKKMSSKLQPGLSGLAKTPEAGDKAERLAELVYGLADKSGDAIYEPAVAEARRFQVRFPDYKENDRIQWGLAQLHMNSGKYPAVLLAYRKLLLNEGSPYREKALFAIGELYADKFKKYKEAVDSFQDFVERYPQSERVLPALERTAVLYSDRLDQNPLAVETYERIIKLFPKTDGALKAFNAEAKLQRERLKQPDEAVKTYQRLAEQFRYPPAAVALIDAAEVCRKDLKDYKREADFRKKVAAEFPTAKEAPEQLYQAAEVTEDDLKDVDGAIKLYQEVAGKFQVHKLGKKAADRAAKLEKNKGG